MLRQLIDSARDSSSIVRCIVFVIIAFTAIGAAGLRMQSTAVADDETETPTIAASDDALEMAPPAPATQNEPTPVVADPPAQMYPTAVVTALLRVSRQPAGDMSTGGDAN